MTTKPVKGTAIQQMMGGKFLEARLKYGVTLQAIADEIQCSINTIRWHEAGHRCLRGDVLMRVAAVMGCCPTELILTRKEIENV